MADNKDPGPQLGQLITDGDLRRDAIHIAVAPVTATCGLSPGSAIGFVEDGNAELVHAVPLSKSLGIVDPFLPRYVEPGQRFWMFLHPGTITGLRHVWTHPWFTKAAQDALAKLQARS